MRHLYIKLAIAFAIVSLISTGIIAFWVHNSVQSEFITYCQRNSQGQTSADSWCSPNMRAGWNAKDMMSRMGAAEQLFIESFNRYLWLAALFSLVTAIIAGFLLSHFMTGPLRQLATATRKVAAGDFTPRITRITNDEIGEVSSTFNMMTEQLQKKETSRKQLLANIAHELRNPLSIVQGNLEAWRDNVISPTHEQISSVYDETVLLARLITDLKELSLAEAGQITLHQESVNISELVNDLISNIPAFFSEKHIDVIANIPSDLPYGFADEGRIRQVLRNLLDNALHFTTNNGIITISAVAQQDWLKLSVSDSGSGIAPEDMPYIFDHFYKADRARTRGYSGTGIGLALVKQLVELHKGRVWVESQPGVGSIFYFTIPSV